MHLPFEVAFFLLSWTGDVHLTTEVVMTTTLNSHSKHSRYFDRKAIDYMEMNIIGDEVTKQPCRLRVRVRERVCVEL